MSRKPIFVLVTAEDCGYCTILKERIWSTLRAKILKQNKVDIVEIHLPSRSAQINTNIYPRDLKRFIGWFPTMILFPRSSWYNNIGKDGEDLIGIIKNGKIAPATETTPEKFIQVGEIDFSEESVLNWINAEEQGLISRSEPVSNVKPAYTGIGYDERDIVLINSEKTKPKPIQVPTSGSYAIYMRPGTIDFD
jgi:hypothetical protein